MSAFEVERDGLDRAHDALNMVESTLEWSEDESISEETATRYFVKAQAYATQALAEAAAAQVEATREQTEQLKRIADLMEAYADVYLDGAVTTIANEK